MLPFLKWPGGKHWLIQKYSDRIPNQFEHYYEPFVGGGAIFFSLLPQNATISDINPELINLYIIMRDKPLQLREEMEKHQKRHCKDYYYQIRATAMTKDVERAGRFLYLNRTCYNGMYRENRNGQFNVPKGTKENCIYDIDSFLDYSTALKNTTILATDFSVILDAAGDKDLIFADPPYKSKNGTEFIKYNDKLFSWEDQLRLYRSLTEAKARGAKIILTNADYPEIRELYCECGFITETVYRNSMIAGKNGKRGQVGELLIISP